MIHTHGSCLALFNTVTLRLRLFVCVLAMLCAPAWAGDKPSEVHILVDVSGSMKKTDPNNLRKPALDMLSELLPSGSKSGIWAFGREINMMLAPAQVDAGWRTKAKQTAAAMRSVGLNTNLTDALASGLYQNKNADAGAFEQHVILITDGKIDMAQEGDPSAPENAAAKRRLLDKILPKYSTQNVKLHSLALSDQADRALLQQLSLATGGLFVQVAEAKDLLPAFLSLFDRAVPTEQAPLIDNHFVIDDSVREFTALMFRTEDAGPSTLIMPNGDKLTRMRAAKDDGVRWHNDIHFDLVTVKSPPAGRWGIQGQLDPNNRIQILTDLSLDVSGVPNSLFAGDPINLSVMLTEQGEAITEPALLGLTDISLKVTAPDGRTGSKLLSDPEQLPSDGRFNETMGKLNQFGEYHFEITAQGRTFERRQSVSATLLQPMNIATEEVLAEQTLYVRVKPSSEYLDVKLSRVIARIEAPDASSDIHPLNFNEDKGEWQLALKAQKGAGQYRVQLNVRGVSTTGAMFKSKPEAIAVSFPLRDLASVSQDGEAPVASSESLADSTPSSSDNGAQETLAPNLAEKFQQQTASPSADSGAPSSQEPSPDASVEDDEFADTDDDSSSWWWITILVVVLLGALGGGGFWWWRKKQAAKPVATAAPAAKGSLREDDEPADNQNVAGDFDEFSGEDEEPIHNSVDASGDVPVLDGDDQVEEGASVQDIPTLADTAGESESESTGVDVPPGSVLNEMVADDSGDDNNDNNAENNSDEPVAQDEAQPTPESEMSEEELAAAQWAEMAAEEESSAETQSSDEAGSDNSEDAGGDDSAMSEEELAAAQWAEMAAEEENNAETESSDAEGADSNDSTMSEEELAAAQWAEMAAEEENESAPEEQDTAENAEEPAASDTAESAGEGGDPYAGMSDDERMAAEWSAAMDADDDVSDANEDDEDASEENEDDAEILDESFNIDPESSTDGDDWGEFDVEKQLDKDK